MAALTAALSSGAVTAAEGACLFSLPTLFTKRPRYLFVSFSPKSIRYSLRKFSPLPPLVAARASDCMAQQATTEEEREAEDGVSEWGDGQGDDGEEVEDDVEDFVAAWGGGRGGENEESYLEPQQESRLYVGNLPYDLHSDSLTNLFEQAGVVEIAEVIYNKNADQSRGFGFVTMRTVEEAEEAVKKFHRYDLNGRLLTVNIAAPRGTAPRSPPGVRSFKIFVSNLPWQVDEADLEQLFSEHGKVLEAQVIRDNASGHPRSRGFGFVTMSSEAERDDAIAALDGYSLEGRSLIVTLAVDKPRPKRF